VGKQKTITQRKIGLYESTQLWLEGFLGFEHKLVMSK